MFFFFVINKNTIRWKQQSPVLVMLLKLLKFLVVPYKKADVRLFLIQRRKCPFSNPPNYEQKE